jgi:hypothetical protein
MEKLYREPYIDAYCQVWFHLAKLFQRRRLKYEKVNGLTTDAKWWHTSTWPFEPGELKNYEKRTITPRQVIRFTSKLQGMSILTSWTCYQFTLNIYIAISYIFWNKGWKVLTFWKFDEKKGNYSKMGTQIYLKIAGYVDPDMLNMFAV